MQELHAHSLKQTSYGTKTICNKLCKLSFELMYICPLQCRTLASPIAGVQNKKLILVLIVFYRKAQTVDDSGGGALKK